MIDDLAAFREEMKRRGVSKRYSPRGRTLAEKALIDARKGRRSIDITELSIKQLASAFAFAKSDSDAEVQYYRALVEKVAAILKAREGR